MSNLNKTAEQKRLNEARDQKIPWKKWGPYLSERQWGTVREDYSDNGDAWSYFSHDQARSRAYHWGEDGLAGISDDKQLLCFSVALWNGKDPIISSQVTNWTFSDRQRAVEISVNVAGGTDPQRVIELLKSTAAAHPGLTKEPSPQVYVTNFSAGAVTFQLRAWTDRHENWAQLRSDLSVAVNEALARGKMRSHNAHRPNGRIRNAWLGG
jgi:Mechanosensitive ion channel